MHVLQSGSILNRFLQCGVHERDLWACSTSFQKSAHQKFWCWLLAVQCSAVYLGLPCYSINILCLSSKRVLVFDFYNWHQGSLIFHSHEVCESRKDDASEWFSLVMSVLWAPFISLILFVGWQEGQSDCENLCHVSQNVVFWKAVGRESWRRVSNLGSSGKWLLTDYLCIWVMRCLQCFDAVGWVSRWVSGP